MSNLCQNLSVSRNVPLTCINQEICGQKTNLYAILWKILPVCMKIKKKIIAMHHGKF